MNKSIINHTFETTEPKKQDTHKRININTFMTHENELCFGGTDENGEQITVWFDSYEFLEWCDCEHIKQTLTKYINTK
tara:strand:+ start:600 stop:833 length:234 start_codon:yes stop_codon:yes gene_type:complete